MDEQEADVLSPSPINKEIIKFELLDE